MPAPATTGLRNEILDAQRQYWEAMKARDPEKMTRLTAGTYTMVMEEGIAEMDRTAWVEMMTGDSMQLKSYRLDENAASVRQLAPGVAIMAYRAQSVYEQDGTRQDGDHFYSTTWVKEGDHWVSAAGSAAKAGVPQQ